MNGSSLDPDIEQLIIVYHHISGPIFFVINLMVGLLIAFDKDKRGCEYRKYLLLTQVFSTLSDVIFTLCIPILVVDVKVIYNAGFNPFRIRTSTFLIVFFIFFTEIGSSYFCCAYYRRNAIFPEGYRYRWTGVRKTALFVSIRLYALVAATIIYYCTLQIDTPDDEIPTSLNWVFSKPAHMILRPNAYLFVLLAVILLWGGSLFTAIIAIVIELSLQLNSGMAFYISPAVKRYQQRAVRSLKLQGAVPGIVYVIPVVGVFTMLIYSSISGSNDAVVATISALLFNVISMHTVIKSITTVACTRSYQRTLLGLVWRYRVECEK